MNCSRARWCVALVLLILGPAEAGRYVAAAGLGAVAYAQSFDDPSTPRAAAQVTILQINDVYSTVPVDGLGGLARVATIKRQIAASGRTPLLMIGGDFLSSSVASTVFKGEQMIEALNVAGLDVATLGNHEFDFGLDMLLTRMKQAKWQWVIANLLDTRTGRPVGDAPPYVIRTVGALKVGIIGLCITTDSMASPLVRERVEAIDALDAAARYLPEMKRAGADVIVALTHLPFAVDRALAERFPEIDVIVGGHEHFPITAVAGRTLISKAGSEARYVARIDLEKRGAAPPDRYYELIPVTAAIADDPAAAELINAWEARLGAEMDVVVGTTRVPLDAVDVRLRASETNVGNLLADAIRQHAQADVGLMNAGGIRGNRLYPAGELTRRALLQLHPFSNVVCKIEVTGATLLRALEHGAARLPLAAGQFAQVSGIAYRVVPSAPSGSRVRDARVNGTPLDPLKRYTLALPDYLLRGGDGYDMFAESPVLIDPEAGELIVSVLQKTVSAGEINPQTDGRIRIEP
jgi:2',3'-cyclic-nucleotide 2'-phosphodiesterase (5'-nucleotidase family)